jgi:hypothetical protein
LGFLGLGLLGSLLVTFQLSTQEPGANPRRVFISWGTLCLLLSLSAFWLMSQPMEMRGVFPGG